MAAEAGGDLRAGIGSRLRTARERKALTILQAAEKLHVDAKILESLEAEDFGALGAPVYVRGHLRHYAELVGELPAELQALYSNSSRTAQAQPDLTRISRARPTSDPGKLVTPAIIVLVAIGLIGTVWWILSLARNKSHATQGQTQAQGQGSPADKVPAAAAANAAPEIAASDDTNATPTAMAAKQPVAAAGAIKTVAKSSNSAAPLAAKQVPTASAGTAVAGARGRGRAGSSSDAGKGAGAPSSAAATRAPTATPAGTTAAHGKDAELTLKFSADSWAEVYDASGQRLFYDVGAAASAHTVKGPAPLRIVLGNAAGVAVEINGHPTPITSSVLPDGSAQFSINARGRAVRAKPADGG